MLQPPGSLNEMLPGKEAQTTIVLNHPFSANDDYTAKTNERSIVATTFENESLHCNALLYIKGLILVVRAPVSLSTGIREFLDIWAHAGCAGFCCKAPLTLLSLEYPPSHASSSSLSPIQVFHRRHVCDLDPSDPCPTPSSQPHQCAGLWGSKSSKQPFKTKPFGPSGFPAKHFPSVMLRHHSAPWSVRSPWGREIASPGRHLGFIQLRCWIGGALVTPLNIVKRTGGPEIHMQSLGV